MQTALPMVWPTTTSAIASAFASPLSLGDLDAYIGATHRYPLLSEQDEQRLARAFRDDGDLEAARRLVLSHLRLVIAVARGYLNYGIPHADLIQEGNIGLMKAVKRFDPERGVRLVSFAMHWIKAEIHSFIIKNWRLVKVATTKAQRKLFFNLRSLKAELSHRDTLGYAEAEIIANELGVKREEVFEMDARMSGHDLALEASADADGDTAFAPIDYLADDRHEPTQVLENRARDQLAGPGLEKALTTLDERSRHIIESRWLSESSPATLHELAAIYNVSAERIRQIETSALKRLRHVLAPSV